MSKKLKSRQQPNREPQLHSFTVGDLLKPIDSDQVVKQQSKLLQERQKNQRDIWMLNTKPQFTNNQPNDQGCQTDIDADNSPKRRVSRKAFKIKGKNIVLRVNIPQDLQSESDVTSADENQSTINNIRKKNPKEGYLRKDDKKHKQQRNQTLQKKSTTTIFGYSKIVSVGDKGNVKTVAQSSKQVLIKKVEIKKNKNMMQTSQQVLIRRGEWYGPKAGRNEPTQRKKSRFADEDGYEEQQW